MNRLFLVFASIVAIALLITFAPFLIIAAIVFWLFRKKHTAQTFQTPSSPSLDTEVIEASWKEVRHENA